MKNIVSFLSFFVCINLFAQQPDIYPHLQVKSINKVSLLPSFIDFSQSSQNRPSVDNINTWFMKNLNANSDFNLVSIKTNLDIAGNTHIKYQQFYNNIPVEGGIVNTHLTNGIMQNLNGNYFPQLNLSTTPALSETAALNMILSKYGNVEFAWQNKAEEALLKHIENNQSATYFPHGDLVIIAPGFAMKQEACRLAYKFNVYVTEPLSREIIYIDAITGDELYSEQLIQTTDVKGYGTTKYSGTQTFTCDSIAPDSFILRQKSRGNGIQTYNAKQLSKLDTNKIFISKTNTWNLKNANKDEVALDVQWGMEKTYDFYKQVLGINGINDSGYKMVGLVHYRTNYNNANWSGTNLNFGDGDGFTFKPLTSLDICGHEMTHGLTQSCAGLKYKDESGGLNESFSDIFGKCIEHYAMPDSFTWTIGKSVQFNGNFLRSMSNPILKQNPKYYGGQYFITAGTAYDNGGVHINSGIQNYWFYLLCEGGTGTREIDNKPFTVKAIGWAKATAVAYTTLSAYLTPNSEFLDASDLSQTVAQSLYGLGSEEADQVKMAWYAVGLASMPGSNIMNTQKLSNAVSISPNPADNLINVSIRSNAIMKTEITDISGKSIHSVNVYNGAGIDISFLERGIYLLRFEDGSCIKFVKI